MRTALPRGWKRLYLELKVRSNSVVLTIIGGRTCLLPPIQTAELRIKEFNRNRDVTIRSFNPYLIYPWFKVFILIHLNDQFMRIFSIHLYGI